ncbi:hypothetical protein CesoFtcFv8_013579 [Champsocephalus esox]|uniref:Uncharacterized protein n=1 Tax=Champsocephalus esox TaxID=159716 RepID=A0AAN8BR93_9TELE|nr:hypothetical protein CesoFtcFv8_013579 [Champsocephalus esox]
MDQLSDEEVEVREDDEEEDSDKEDQDLDKMFGAWLGELDKLTQSLDDGRPEEPPQQKAPLRQETNMANFSYRFSIYNINEALNQGENVDLDALMADLCSIEQELSTINTKPNSSGGMARLGLTDAKVRQKPPAGRSRGQQPAGGTAVTVSVVGGGSSGASSNSSSTRASPAGTIRAAAGHHGRPALASNFSLDDITAQLEKASLSMDEAALQTSSHSLSSASSYTSSATMRRPGSSQRQHRRAGSVGTVSEHEARSIVHSSRSSVTSASGVSVNSASSMDSLDSVLCSDADGQPPSVLPAGEGAAQVHHSTEVETTA